MSNINALKNIPEISFIDNITLEDIRNEMLDDYQEAYRAETGKEPDMNAGTPERLMLYAFANNFYQALKYIDRAGKMGLLKYSEADYLDNLAVLKGITRNEATAAKVTLKFTLSDIRTSVTAIPGGPRVQIKKMTKALRTEFTMHQTDTRLPVRKRHMSIMHGEYVPILTIL